MANYITSDWHFGHDSIIEWERTQFKDIAEHDIYILNSIKEQAQKMHKGDTFYFLGDFGDISYLPAAMLHFKMKEVKTIFIAGNHDKVADKELFEKYFDEVYWHPLYLSERIILSHFPANIWEGQVNCHGHTHGAIIDNNGYISCSINDTNYKFITDKNINNAFGKIGKFNTTFLYEPWADKYKFTTRDTSDLIVDHNKRIDLPATRAYRKMIMNKENTSK